MNLFPTMATLKTVAWALAALAVVNRVPAARKVVQGV